MATGEVIRTERLLLEPFTEKHLAERYVSWLNNPQVVRYSEQRHRTHTLETCRSYLASFQETPNYFWAICQVEGPHGHIGNISADVDVANGLADVGILIGETEVWGQGYGTEAWKAVCDYLLHRPSIRKVTAGTISLNQGMLKIMQKSGMVPDGRRVRHYLWEGKEVDVIYMALFKE